MYCDFKQYPTNPHRRLTVYWWCALPMNIIKLCPGLCHRDLFTCAVQEMPELFEVAAMEIQL